MDCPSCGNAMITLELADVEIDHCVGCGGIWLDAGELELLLDDPRKAAGLLASFQEAPSAAEHPRKCPICDKKMAKVVVGCDKPVLLIDKCRRGDGLWFDGGELKDVLDRGRLDEDSRIRKLLADMFAHDESKQK
ncbi:MAG: zf-TFIIB domain-containing protein [Sedimentisphaerales bacterium]|nr:zf-TFIIB domain-containing protein [Sedimentisphaerales bacterium]HNY80030.1 zf-TFIIB domain-containing protein [Sedimentisphaerales bacterium]HOC64096.1 zf-TFIIB domain-containing protein [Sedimentisphaerales bacterium]HOH65850.1 zf-TFIIB domain-containing protein [Sedimentisphaerales bacterium]HPY50240.1 zf-TFIIB domain-containing protein [Sedimentisphaerales bacterium]